MKYTNEALAVGLGPADIGLVALSSMKAPSLELEQGLRPPKASADHLLVFFLSSWRSKLFCDYEKKSETVGGETSKEEIATKIIPKVVLLKKAEKWPRGSFQKFRQNWKGYRIMFEKNGFERKLLNF